jgi:oligoribonuclease
MGQVRLVWIDLEMTGLNSDHDVILEVAVIVTGPDLKPLAQIERVVFQPEDVLTRMSAKVREIHTANGLLEEVRTRGLDMRVVERDVLKVISAHTGAGQGLLCGRSVHHDWKFLVKYMPRLEQHLHFQRVDVSTFGVLVDAWFPGLPQPVTRTNHRALADVQAGLEELRFYCEKAFRVDLERVAAAR